MTAPIDPRLLQPLLDGGPGSGRPLPDEAYTSDEVLAWEMRRFFEDGWVCVGPVDDISAPGDQIAYRVGREGVLVVRGADEVVRAFYNTCRHRGHELLQPGETRSRRAIRCPYHAWVYRLDGALSAAPLFGGTAGFRRTDYPLVAVPVESWLGWLFVNASGDDPPWGDRTGILEGTVAALRPERLVVADTHTDEMEANWKTITEHCLRQPVPEPSDAHPPVADPGALFPSLLLRRYPDALVTHRLEPLRPGRTRVECRVLVRPEVLGVGGSTPATVPGSWDIADERDRRPCAWIHRSLAEGPEVVSSVRADGGVRAFRTTVARGYLEGRVPASQRPGPAPRAGR